jgi:hypothetical protein
VHPSALSDWRWEGNVQSAIARHLRSNGWVVREADAAAQEHGVDIDGQKGSRRLQVEVKGYPSTTYVSGAKAGQPKPTNPRLQARHWFSHAMLTALQLRSRDRDAETAIGLPSADAFETLADSVRESMWKVGIGLVFVLDDSGTCEWQMLPAKGDAAVRALPDATLTAVIRDARASPDSDPLGTFTWRGGRFVSTGDVTPFDDDRHVVVMPGNPPIRVRQTDGEAYVVAAVMSQNQTYFPVELVDDRGHRLSPEDIISVAGMLDIGV